MLFWPVAFAPTNFPWLRVVIGVLFSTIVAHFILEPLNAHLRRLDGKDNPAKWPMNLYFGCTERSLYFGALYFGFPAAIPVWIGMKIAVLWEKKDRFGGSSWLIMNALSFGCAFGGACFAFWGVPSIISK